MRSRFSPDSVLSKITGESISWNIDPKEVFTRLQKLPAEKLEKLLMIHETDIVLQFSKCLHNCFFMISKKEENASSVFDHTIMKNNQILFILIRPERLSQIIINDGLNLFLKDLLILLCNNLDPVECQQELNNYMVNSSVFSSKKKIILAKPKSLESYIANLSKLNFKDSHKLLKKSQYSWFFKECRREFLYSNLPNEKPYDLFARTLDLQLQVISYLISNNIMKYLHANNAVPQEMPLILSISNYSSDWGSECERRSFDIEDDDIYGDEEDELIRMAMMMLDNSNYYYTSYNSGIPLLQTLHQGLIFHEMKGNMMYNNNYYSYGNSVSSKGNGFKKSGKFRTHADSFVPKNTGYGNMNEGFRRIRKYSRPSN